MKTIKKTKGKYSKNLTFAQFDHLGADCIVITDHDCQKERTYTLGNEYVLDIMADDGAGGYIYELVTSFDQVIKAWEEGKVWF